MTGPGHYREAEAILAEIQGDEAVDKISAAAALAQVHATLALAAATATARGNADPYDWAMWREVTS